MKQMGERVDGVAKEEVVSLRLRLRRASGSPYTAPLSAEVYVIGRQLQTGYLGIIDVVKKEFNFSEERTFEFKTPTYRLKQTEGNIQKTGNVYETFLVVVVDEEGVIVESRSGRVIQEKGIEFIRKQGRNTLFDRDGNVVGVHLSSQRETNEKLSESQDLDPEADQ
jgi:hypothetical protein